MLCLFWVWESEIRVRRGTITSTDDLITHRLWLNTVQVEDHATFPTQTQTCMEALHWQTAARLTGKPLPLSYDILHMHWSKCLYVLCEISAFWHTLYSDTVSSRSPFNLEFPHTHFWSVNRTCSVVITCLKASFMLIKNFSHSWL